MIHRVLKSHRSKISIICMLSWKQCALPVTTTMALWQLMHLGTWCTVAHCWYQWAKECSTSEARSINISGHKWSATRRVLKYHRSKMSMIYMLSWKQYALPVITTMALWQLMQLGAWCTVTHSWYQWTKSAQ